MGVLSIQVSALSSDYQLRWLPAKQPVFCTLTEDGK